MDSGPNILRHSPSCSSCLLQRRLESDLPESLKDPSNRRGGFVTCKLLSGANSWTCVECEENARFRKGLLFDPVVQESV